MPDNMAFAVGTGIDPKGLGMIGFSAGAHLTGAWAANLDMNDKRKGTQT